MEKASDPLRLEVLRIAAEWSPVHCIIGGARSWDGPGRGLTVPLREGEMYPLAVGVYKGSALQAVLIIVDDPITAGAVRLEGLFVALSADHYKQCWPPPAPMFSILYGNRPDPPIAEEAWLIHYTTTLCGARDTPIFSDQLMRDATLVFYWTLVAPRLSPLQLQHWLDAEQAIVLHALRESTGTAEPSLMEWLYACREMTVERAPPLHDPLPFAHLAAAQHVLELVHRMPAEPPPVPEELEQLVATLVAGHPESMPIHEKGKPIVSRQERREEYAGAMPDLEDLYNLAPPCIQSALQHGRAAGKLMDKDRYYVANWLAALGYTNRTDVPRLSAFVLGGDAGNAAFGKSMREAMKSKAKYLTGCMKIAADTTVVSCVCAFKDPDGTLPTEKGRESLRCARSASFHGMGYMKNQADYTLFATRKREDGKK